MKTAHKIIGASLLLGLMVWMVDAVQDYLFFYEGSFWDLLIADPPPHEMVIRSFFLVSSLLFGMVLARLAGEREEREGHLEVALHQGERRQAETAALLKAAQAVLHHRQFEEAARAIFDCAREIIGAPAGYISLSDKTGSYNEVVFLEAGGLPCTVDPGTLMPIRGLRAEAYQSGQGLYDNNFAESPYTAYLPEGHVAMENVLFAPLLFDGKPVGLLGLGNKPGGFTDQDVVLAGGFADLAAIALVSKQAESERERLIQQLEAERSFLETVVEQMPAGVTIAEADSGRVILGNKELKEIWGLTELPSDLQTGLSQVQVYHPDGQPYGTEEWPLMRALAQGPAISGQEAEVIRKDGSRRTLRVSAAPIRDSQGTVVAGVSTWIDITGRKRMEQALQESRKDLNRAQAVAHTGSWRLDVRKNELTWSDENHRIFGIPPGTPMTYETFLSTVHPEDREYVDRKWKAALQGEHYDIEHRIVVGEKVKWVRERVELEFNHEGEMLGGFGTTQDITELKEAEREIHRLASFPLLNPNPVLEVDAEGRVLFANPAARQAAEKLGLPEGVGAFLPPDLKEKFAVARQGSPRQYRVDLPLKDNVYAVSLSFPHDLPTARLYALNITERKRAEQALQEAHDGLERRVEERTAELRQTVEHLQIEMDERERAEAKLRESEARFRTLFQTAGSFIFSISPENRILEFNEEAERVTGWKKDEVAGKDGFALFLSEADRALGEAELSKVLSGGITRSFELPIRLKDKSERTFLWNANAVSGSGSSPLEIIVVGHDITARKQAEEALREQSNILNAFFDHTITPLVFLDREFHFLRVNEAYARACHREVPEFLGRNHFDFYPHEENQAIFSQVVQTKKPYQAIAKPFIFPDHPEWGVTYWDWTLVPILDDNGEVDFLVFSLNDVTAQVLAEERKAQLIDIIEATPDFVGTADLEGRVLYINQAGRRMVGLGPEEDLSTWRIIDCHPPGTGRSLMSEALPAVRRDGSWRGESCFLARDGREIPTSQVILVHRGPDGQEAFYSTIARDISDMKQAEEKLRLLTSQLLKAQEDERRRLSRELHDDLGQSLLVLKMQARTIERNLPQGQEVLREDCGRALKYIDEIIENVRRLSRDLSPSILEDLGLAAALNYLFEEFRRHHTSVNFLVEQEPLDQYISREAQMNIFRIFQESLTNIAKHAQPSRVKVGLKKQEEALLGEVEDDGEGFAVDEVLTKDGYDRGMGLATMDERVRIIGGSLRISSEKGKGTKVAFRIPLGKDI